MSARRLQEQGGHGNYSLARPGAHREESVYKVSMGQTNKRTFETGNKMNEVFKVSKGWLIYLITGRIDDTRRTTVGNRESRGEGEPQVRGNVERVYPGMARGGDGIETDRT